MLHNIVLYLAAWTAGVGEAAEFSLPSQWIHGAPGEPSLQVHEAAAGTWLLRQGKANNFEAPFMVLLAGKERALLLDTGAKPGTGGVLPLRAEVDRLLGTWASKLAGKPLSLTVAHSHGHGDHHYGDPQFRDRKDTRIVGTAAADVATFFDLPRWPDGEARIDLGDRILSVMPLPGHEPAHIGLYDVQTQTLFTGDMLYPGLLTVRDWPAFRASAARLEQFASTHAVARVIGAHIEMTNAAGRMYPLETAFQPEEHGLALQRRHVHELAEACEALGDFLSDDVHEDFILGRVSAPSTDRPSIHGMLVVGSDSVYLSHLPMMHSPHNYQLIFEAELPSKDLLAYRNDAKLHPSEIYTLAPTEEWVLPETIKQGAAFTADLDRGHFERGGSVLLRGIRVVARQLVHFRRFEAGRKPDPQHWIGFGGGTQHFAAHRIEGVADFDQLVELDSGAGEARHLHTASGRMLQAGEHIGDARVARVIYTETADLAK